MYRRQLFFLFILALCISCTGQSSFFKTRELKGEVVFEKAPAYMFVAATDSSVLAYNPYDTMFLTSYAPSNTNKFLRRGEGLYDAFNPIRGVCVEGKNLYVVDHTSLSNPHKILTIDLTSPYDSTKWEVEDISWIGSARPFNSITKLSANRFLVGSGRYGSGTLLSCLDIENKEFVPVDYQIATESQIFLPVQELALASFCIVGPYAKDGKYAYVCKEGSYLEIFELNNASVTNRLQVLDVKPRFKQNGNTYSMLDRKNRGLRVRATGRNLFVYYNHPVELRGYKGYPGYFNDYIDVFDWKGKRIKRLMFDRPFSDFILSDNGDIIYASTIDPKTGCPLIIKYLLHNR